MNSEYPKSFSKCATSASVHYPPTFSVEIGPLSKFQPAAPSNLNAPLHKWHEKDDIQTLDKKCVPLLLVLVKNTSGPVKNTSGPVKNTSGPVNYFKEFLTLFIYHNLYVLKILDSECTTPTVTFSGCGV